jgi:hypothetical protein
MAFSGTIHLSSTILLATMGAAIAVLGPALGRSMLTFLAGIASICNDAGVVFNSL